MRLSRRVFISIAIIIVAIIIFMPPLVGFGIQKIVDKRLFLSGSQENKAVEILDYHRGWFTSTVTVRINISNDNVSQVLARLGIPESEIPHPLVLLMEGRIQHGPIFYKSLRHFKSFFGIAVVDRKLIIPPEEQKLFASLGITPSTVRADQTFLTITGKYLNHFELKDFKLTIPKGQTIYFMTLQGNIWAGALSQKIRGNIEVTHLSISDASTSITLPKSDFHLDLYKDANGLWLGSYGIFLSEFLAQEKGYPSFSLENVQLSGVLHENNGLINGEKQFSIGKLQSNSRSIGPFEMQLSVNQLNAKGIAQLLHAVIDVSEHGEMYESQLRDRILMLLPSITTSGSAIQLNRLSIYTPSGRMEMNAKLDWPSDYVSQDSDAIDLLRASNLHASMRISIPLLNDFIDSMATLTYFYQIPNTELYKILELGEDVKISGEQNVLLIKELISNGALNIQDSVKLLNMAKRTVSKEKYFAQVKKLLLTRKISRETSYMLDWQYGYLSEEMNTMEQSFNNYREAAKKQLLNELAAFIKQGYLKKEDDDYVSVLDRQGPVIKINGQLIQQLR